MKKLKLSRRIYLALSIFSLLSILLGTPAMAYAALEAYYVVMSLIAVVIAHGFYGLPFYFRAFRRRGVMIKYMDALANGICDSEGLANATCLSEKGQAKYMALMIKKGYYAE